MYIPVLLCGNSVAVFSQPLSRIERVASNLCPDMLISELKKIGQECNKVSFSEQLYTWTSGWSTVQSGVLFQRFPPLLAPHEVRPWGEEYVDVCFDGVVQIDVFDSLPTCTKGKMMLCAI